MVYAGVESRLIPDDLPLHQQIVAGEPMGEGNTVFLSFSPEWDQGRAPAGQRVLTMSTHTQLAPWWQLRNSDEAGYEARKQVYLEKMFKRRSLFLATRSNQIQHGRHTDHV